MIASISRGAGFRGLLAYVLDPKHDPTVVATNMCGETPGELAWQFRAGSRQRRAEGRPDVLKPVVHVSLSFAPDDRKMSDAELSIVAEQFLTRMGYGDCPHLAVEHKDRGHQHLHLVVSRVRLDGSLAREELRDFYKAMEVCRQLEREHGLRQVLAQEVSGLHQATKDEYRHALRHEEPSERMQLQAIVGGALAGHPCLGEFVCRLEDQGVEVRIHRAHDGPIVGISYRLERYAFRGSALGSSFTWPGLLAAGVQYDQRRDQDVVERLASWATDVGPPALGREQLDRIRSVVDRTLHGRPDLATFVERIESHGLGVQLNIARTGHVSGIRFVMGDVATKGSDIGREYSWAGLRKRGLDYSAERDGALVAQLGGGGGGGGGDRPDGKDRARLEADEARRLTPEYQRELIEGAPPEAILRETGSITATTSMRVGPDEVERLRAAILESARTEFASEPQSSGVSLYPLAGYLGEQPATAETLTRVDGYALVWRNGANEVVGAAYVDDCTKALEVPPRLRAAFADYANSANTLSRRSFERWWLANHHQLEGGEVTGIAVDTRAFDREETRRAVREMNIEIARHRVDWQLPHETRTGSPTALTTDGARALEAQRADLKLASAIALAAVRNPQALERLAVMPDTGRPLTRAEVIRGTLDVAHGGGRQFHIEALALKRSVRPLLADAGVFREAFGFELAELPAGSILVRATVTEGRHALHFEDALGRRLEEHNAPVLEADGREAHPAAPGVADQAGARAGGRVEGQDGSAQPDAEAARQGVEPPVRPDRAAATTQEVERARLLLDQALAGRPTLPEFVARLEKGGLSLRLYQRPDGKVFAVGYRLGETIVKPRVLGEQYRWPALAAVLRPDAGDLAAVQRAVRIIPWDERHRSPQATADSVALVRQTVAEALAGGASLTQFVGRVGDRGVDVRLFYDDDGRILSIGYRHQGVSIPHGQLGAGYSWRRLQGSGLHYDPTRDALTAQAIGRPLPTRNDRAHMRPSFEQLEYVRALVGQSLSARVTLTEFVQRMEAGGVEVRLYTDRQGAVRAIAYGLPDATISGREMGPGQRWHRLLRRGLDYDPIRDGETVARVLVTIVSTEQQRPRATEDDRNLVRAIVTAVLAGHPTLPQFVRAVEGQGIEVRLWQDPVGAIVGIGYGWHGVSLSGAELGPGHSWQRLITGGLDYDPVRDADVVRLAAETLTDRAWTPGQAAEHERAWVREAVRDVLDGRPTLGEFVERVEERGIEVRLYRDDAGSIYAIGYGLGRLHLSGHDLGPKYTWQGLQEHGLKVDPERDREALERVAQTLSPRDTSFHLLLHAADRAAHAVNTASRWLAQCEELIEDPASAVVKAAARAAYNAALRSLGELLVQAGRDAQEGLAETRDRELLAAAGQDRGGNGVSGPPSPSGPVEGSGRVSGTGAQRDHDLIPGQVATVRDREPVDDGAVLSGRSDQKQEAREHGERSAERDAERDADGRRVVGNGPGAPGRVADDSSRAAGGGTDRVPDGWDAVGRSPEGDIDRGVPAAGDIPQHVAAADGEGPRRDRGLAEGPGRAVEAAAGSGRDVARDAVAVHGGPDPARPGPEAGRDGSRVVEGDGAPAREPAGGGAGATGRSEEAAVGRAGQASPRGPQREAAPVREDAAGGADRPRPLGRNTAPLVEPAAVRDRQPSREDRHTGAASRTQHERSAAVGGAGRPARTGRDATAPSNADDRMGAALDRLRAALAAARAHSQAPVKDALRQAATAAVARAAPVIGTALPHLPSPGRMKALAENPEKAALAAASTGVSMAVPPAAPVVKAVTGTIEKHIDRAQQPERDGPTR